MPDILALPVKFGDFSISLMVSGLGQDVNLLESPPTDKSEDRVGNWQFGMFQVSSPGAWLLDIRASG
jgi:hypothetical protein